MTAAPTEEEEEEEEEEEVPAPGTKTSFGGTSLMVLGESTKFAVSGSVAVALLVRRDAATLVWVAGAIGAAVLNKVLKRLIGEARPTDREPDPGMPSSHACSLFHLGTGIALRLPVALHPRTKALCVAGLAAYATTSIAWRVKARYHTTAQVLVGALVGASTAVAWFAAARGLRLEETLAATTGDVGLVPLAAILVLGALVVGSLERSKLFKKLVGNDQKRP